MRLGWPYFCLCAKLELGHDCATAVGLTNGQTYHAWLVGPLWTKKPGEDCEISSDTPFERKMQFGRDVEAHESQAPKVHTLELGKMSGGAQTSIAVTAQWQIGRWKGAFDLSER